jgi:hypothetical protein
MLQLGQCTSSRSTLGAAPPWVPPQVQGAGAYPVSMHSCRRIRVQGKSQRGIAKPRDDIPSDSHVPHFGYENMMESAVMTKVAD